MKNLMKWDIYEISAKSSKLEGVMLRGRIRKFSIQKEINLLVENASDEENKVRFALFEKENATEIISKIKEMVPDAEVKKIKESMINPVLSKLKVNQEERY